MKILIFGIGGIGGFVGGAWQGQGVMCISTFGERTRKP